MICYLVRHAQTLWNQDNRFQGKTDMPLGPRGVVQAQRLAARFATARFAAVYSSPLMRSRQTADAIAVRAGAAVRIEPGIAEMDLGDWEGLTGEQIDVRFDGAFGRWCVRPSQVPVSGGEPVEAFRRRAREGFARVLAPHRDGEQLLVVSHGGVIASLLADWTAVEYDTMLRQQPMENASVTIVRWSDGAPSVVRINDTEHLLPQRRPRAERVS
jgi:broad specificity phosphatase PhoE